MKTTHLVILFSLLSIPACGEGTEREKAPERDTSAEKASGGITWHSSLSDGLTLARSEGKPLMVDFYSDSCGWCKIMDKKTFRNSAVRKLGAEFIQVKVDLQKDSSAAKKYGIRGLPTVLFMNREGEVIHKVIGFTPPKPFVAEMKTALGKAKGD